MTYLDHAATTPMRPAAVEAMLPFFTERFANPSGSHRFARDARKAIDEARDQVAELVGVRPGEVVFTGCGTEADNMAVIGGGGDTTPGRVVCSAAEHHAVLHPVEHAGGTVVGVDAAGHIDLDQLAAALNPEVRLVTVMAVNNEVGTISDLAAVSALVRRLAPQALLHTDAIQAAHWIDLRTIAPLVDMMSLSAHKFGGPKGVGVLTIADRAAFSPLLRGGGQERERRSGTHNVAGIVGLAVALAETDAERDAENARIAAPSRSPARRSAGRRRRRARDRAARPQGGRWRPRVPGRGRERVVAVPARRGRGVRQRRLGLRQRSDGAVARAGGDGRRPLAGVGRAAHDASGAPPPTPTSTAAIDVVADSVTRLRRLAVR